MPRKKGFKHSAEAKVKMSIAKIGRKLSAEHKSKIAKGNKGKIVSIETREKMSRSNVGKKRSAEARMKMSKAKLGKKRAGNPRNWRHTEASKKRMSETRKGKKLSEETKIKLKSVARYGSENREWKGDKVGYRALHHWIARNLGKAKKCSACGKEGNGREIHWANIDHRYRRKVEDFMELCIACHAKYDKSNGIRRHGKIN